MAAPVPADVCGVSVRGIKHVESGEPNQDAISLAVEPVAGISVAAVSDGHSGTMHFRSDVGATIAVETAINAFAELIPELTGAGFEHREWLATHGFATRLFGLWSQRVRSHLERTPFQPEDFDRIVRAAGPQGLRMLTDHPALAYGATLLAVANGPGYCVAVQLGDGEVIGESAYGVERLLPIGRQGSGGRTATIAALAHEDLRLRILEGDQQPFRVLLCSDGFSQAFKSEGAFMSAARDMLGCAGPSDDQNRSARLEGLLRQVSLHGSQDDVTLALIGDPNIANRVGAVEYEAMLARWMPQLARTPDPKRPGVIGRIKRDWLRLGRPSGKGQR